MKQNIELSERIKQAIGIPSPLLHDVTFKLLTDCKRALETFDVMQHLRDGGRAQGTDAIFTLVGSAIHADYGNTYQPAHSASPASTGYFVDDLIKGTLTECHEPPAEGTQKWAMEQMENGLSVSEARNPRERYKMMADKIIIQRWVGNKHCLDVGCDIFIQRYPDTGWSLCIEPVMCLLCGNEILKKEDGPPTVNGVPLAHYECHGKYETYRDILETPEDEIDLDIKIGGTD